MNKYNEINGCTFKRKYLAFYIDFLICIVLVMFSIFPVLIFTDLFSIELKTEVFVDVFSIIAMILLVILLLIKDFIFKDGSIGKKIMKIKIIDIKTKQKPSPFKLIFSNFCFLNFGIIDYLVSKNSLDNRTLAELVTSTIIVERKWKAIEEKAYWEE